MGPIVFDIETSSVPFESLSESQQEYLLRRANKEKDDELRAELIEDEKRFTSLYPFTAKCIAIGIYVVDSEKAGVLYESDIETDGCFIDNHGTFTGRTEAEMLRIFWKYAEQSELVVSFNGRGFDVPFLNLRSAILGVKPTRNLMGYRYDTKNHVDLLEMFSYYGAFKRFNLDFYCHGFGVESSKAKGVTGMDVKELYEKGEILRVAEYCVDDIIATYELYKIWREYLAF